MRWWSWGRLLFNRLSIFFALLTNLNSQFHWLTPFSTTLAFNITNLVRRDSVANIKSLGWRQLHCPWQGTRVAKRWSCDVICICHSPRIGRFVQNFAPAILTKLFCHLNSVYFAFWTHFMSRFRNTIRVRTFSSICYLIALKTISTSNFFVLAPLADILTVVFSINHSSFTHLTEDFIWNIKRSTYICVELTFFTS